MCYSTKLTEQIQEQSWQKISFSWLKFAHFILLSGDICSPKIMLSTLSLSAKFCNILIIFYDKNLATIYYENFTRLFERKSEENMPYVGKIKL